MIFWADFDLPKTPFINGSQTSKLRI